MAKKFVILFTESWGVCHLSYYLDRLVTALMNRRLTKLMHFQDKVIKEHTAPASIAGTFCLRFLNYHVRSPTTT